MTGPLFISPTNSSLNTIPNPNPNPNPNTTSQNPQTEQPPDEAKYPQYTPYRANRDMTEFVRLLHGLQNFLCAKGYKVELLDVTKFTSELRKFLEQCEKVRLP